MRGKTIQPARLKDGSELKPNVLQLIGSFHQGGSERQAVQLARLLKGSGRYNVRVACMDRAGVLGGEVESLALGEIPEYRLTSFYDRNALTEIRRFALHLQKRGIDIIQTHDFYTNVFGMAAARLARVPVRIAARRETTGWRTRAQKIVERNAYRFAHAIVANSEAVRHQLIKEGVGAKKIVTVYNGLDRARVTVPPDFKREEALAELGLQTEANCRFVTIVANLRHEVKDHATFLRAARRVRDRVPESRFVIAGEGELTDSMRALAAGLGIERDVFFAGRTERVAPLLAVSDVCVLSSKAEGFSNSILEYMAAARPVVVTDVGGAREAVTDGEAGYIVAAGDDPVMADRIVRLLGDPERARAMGERGRQIVEQKFSCEAQLEQVEKLYDRMIAATTRPVPQSFNNARSEIV
ncbi:MAG TPA: glycosyltransferase [Blastocatellia bacterium]|nr:glycosyltransferase [Blastocatellia bacterium]